MLYLAYIEVALKYTAHAKTAHLHDCPSCKCAAFLFVGETCHLNLMTLPKRGILFSYKDSKRARNRKDQYCNQNREKGLHRIILSFVRGRNPSSSCRRIMMGPNRVTGRTSVKPGITPMTLNGTASDCPPPRRRHPPGR